MYFLIQQKWVNFHEKKMLVSTELKGCVTKFIYFWIFFRES